MSDSTNNTPTISEMVSSNATVSDLSYSNSELHAIRSTMADLATQVASINALLPPLTSLVPVISVSP